MNPHEQSRSLEFQRSIDRVENVFGQTEGAVSASLHRDVMAYAAHRFRGDDVTVDIPPELVSYLDKIALHAYKITDAEVQALQAAGYSEDAIFEITVGGSYGAGLATWQDGIAAINEFFGTDSPTDTVDDTKEAADASGDA